MQQFNETFYVSNGWRMAKRMKYTENSLQLAINWKAMGLWSSRINGLKNWKWSFVLINRRKLPSHSQRVKGKTRHNGSHFLKPTNTRRIVLWRWEPPYVRQNNAEMFELFFCNMAHVGGCWMCIWAASCVSGML